MPRKPSDLAVADFTHAIGLLIRRARAAAAAHELSLTESAVLARLSKDGPAAIADLARAESMKPQSMGATVAALGERGLIARKAHPTDGRQIIIELTPEGADVRKSAGDAKRAWIAQAIAQLDEEDQKILFRAGELIRRLAQP